MLTEREALNRTCPRCHAGTGRYCCFTIPGLQGICTENLHRERYTTGATA